jgi:hypothetical protein
MTAQRLIGGAALWGWAASMTAFAVYAATRGHLAIGLGGAGACLVAAFLLWRRSVVRVALVLLGFGSAAVLSEWTTAYAEVAQPGAAALRPAVVIGAGVFVLVGTLVNTLFMIFPTGDARGRWRWAVSALLAIGGAGTVTGIVWALGQPTAVLVTELATTGDGNNPAELFAAVVFLGFFPASIVSLVLRYRAGHTVERHQIRWLLFAATAVFAVTLTQNVFLGFDTAFGDIAVAIGFMLFPLSIGIAILRYRLFDIDRIISRTLGYVLVIGLLVAVYAVIALLPILVLDAQDTPPWLVAGATLTAAALFSPVRRRVQRAVDRRFNRAHYDAEQVVERLGERMRDTTDPTAISSELAAAVDQILQPAGVGVWTVTGPT